MLHRLGSVLTTRIHESPDDLGGLWDEWDALAVQSERPFTAPAWVLSWWDHLRPGDAQLRLILVHEGDSLVGVVPLYCSKRSYVPLGGGIAPVEPLAKPGLERQVAEAATAALTEASPRPATVEVEAHGSSPDWAGLLGEAWGGDRSAWRWTRLETPVPRVDLGEGFEDWLQAKSSSFRREMKRKQRRLQEAGGSFRFATAESLERDVQAFMRLHRHRLAGQGGTSLSADGVEGMLVSVGRRLLACGRFRLLSIDLDGTPISGQLLLAAGRELSAWNSGFDEAHAKLSPSMLCIVEALRDGSERGERTMSLGPGGQEYKYRLSNQEDSLSFNVLVPHGSTYPLARLGLIPRQVRARLSGGLSPDAKRRLRKLIRQ